MPFQRDDAPSPPRPARIGVLRAELRGDAAWVATPTPRLTWTVETDEPGWLQAWAEIRRGDEIRRIDGAESVLVAWPFAPLAEGEVAEVAVRAGAVDGHETPWSAPLEVAAAFTTAWRGRLIGLADPDAPARPALLRRAFRVERPVRRAVLHTTAFGAADWTVNGAAVDDGVLGPGWTSYRLRAVHDTADVTPLIAPGENILAARLAGAWYTEEYHLLTPPRRVYGAQPSAAAQLRVEYADGSVETIATDQRWRAIPDPETLASGIYAGETADGRGRLDGWDRPGFDDVTWPAAALSSDALPTPEPRIAPPVRRVDTVPVRAVLPAPSGGVILDFGQNLVGRLRIRVHGERGSRIVLRHAEVLEDGDLALRPLRRAAARDEYVLGGGGEEVWEPRFTFHGFRYARIEGWPGPFDADSVEAVVLQTDLPRTGWFSSSDPLLDRFHENVVWTMRGNALAVPMDCPQRDERLGWTGDQQLFAPTAAFLFDCAAFYRSWLRDLALEQERAGGIVPLFAPDAVPSVSTRGPMAGWGDAIAIIPRVLADATGDLTFLDDLYPAMRSWLDVVIGALDDDGLWTAGRQLGDWLDPNAPPDAPARGRTDAEIVATAYFIRSALLVARIARRRGHGDEADRLEHEAEISRAAFLEAYVTPAGRMMCDTQTAYAVAIAFDIVTEERLRARLADRLADVVRRDGYHIATGLVGTSVIAQALTEGGHPDAAERLLLQTESPSWLHPVTVGATTIWERWDGLREDGTLNPGAMISFNHVALGSVAAWLHEDVAGLAPAEPGYRRIQAAPRVLRGIDSARAEHLTPYGRAVVGWERRGGVVHVTAVIPPNTTGDVRLPDGQRMRVGSGSHEWIVVDEPDEPRPPIHLDSSMAELADHPAAYRAFHAALAASPNDFVARAVRANALYRDTLRIRDALTFADEPTVLAIASALASASAPATISA
ncbi:family 78 glycoside hydrolase catalytic domain [Microbacterium oryzae]|uniref:alpha-L-rhamnosidase n=1 Tax=Microbacterium oryzae TaxID=743009 RepID=UPI0025B19B2E|nr:alpha-L-rhamnosidase [Microbacterium oryzae]MDN3310341.1 family 78 glycoside hydrolase catalytic domain [Microbacterium oryzae]